MVALQTTKKTKEEVAISKEAEANLTKDVVATRIKILGVAIKTRVISSMMISIVIRDLSICMSRKMHQRIKTKRA